MNTDLRQLHRDLLKHIGSAKGRWRGRQLSAFAGRAGMDYCGDLLIVGRAVNGWEPTLYVQDVANDVDRERIVEECFANDQCPMAWVSSFWHRKREYSTSRSAFWRVVRSVTGELGIADIDLPTWPSAIAWTNLYKISPAAGGNPSSTLMAAQQADCLSILESEIQSWSPRRVLFLTGAWWAKPFLTAMGFDPVSSSSRAFVEASGTICNDVHAVIAPHPQGRSERPLVAEIVQGFNSLNGSR
jgi:hypothetical protein